MKIVADEQIPFITEYFGTYGDLILLPGRAIAHADVKDADMLLVRSVTRVDKNLLKNTRVKFVGSVTAGADHLDTRWLDEAHIDWNVAVGFNAPPVADYVVSAIAALQKRQIIPGKNLKVAVIGVGNVGRLVVERLKLLNSEIFLCDPVRAQKEKDFISAPIEELSDVDLILLHVPLTKTGDYPTYHFINKAFLRRQKPDTVLLNASRGAVIHSAALLSDGAHLHWCFDVWEREPNIDKSILEQALIATPHIAGYSIQSKIRGIDMIYRIACEKQIIEQLPFAPMQIPDQKLVFAGENHDWRDVVLGIFNPLVMTTVMRTQLMAAQEQGRLFDEMRHQFNYRHEFSSTRIVDAQISGEDKLLLKKLGLKMG